MCFTFSELYQYFLKYLAFFFNNNQFLFQMKLKLWLSLVFFKRASTLKVSPNNISALTGNFFSTDCKWTSLNFHSFPFWCVSQVYHLFQILSFPASTSHYEWKPLHYFHLRRCCSDFVNIFNIFPKRLFSNFNPC